MATPIGGPLRPELRDPRSAMPAAVPPRPGVQVTLNIGVFWYQM